MAKEFEKFNAEYKKLAPALTRCTKAAATKLAADMRTAWLETDGEGVRHFTESLARARDEGVTGTTLDAFSKNRHVADALKVYEISVGNMSKLQQQLLAMRKEALDTKTKITGLVATIDKDLKSRGDRSESKTEIEKLRATLDGSIVQLDAVVSAYDKKHKLELEYVSKTQQRVTALVKAAPATQKSELNATMLPQALVDRNRTKARNQAVIMAKEIAAACDEAITIAGNDLEAAKLKLKVAAGRMTDLKKIHTDFTTAYDYGVKKSALLESKDAAAVKKVKDDIDKAYEIAERKARGAMTTIRKAG